MRTSYRHEIKEEDVQLYTVGGRESGKYRGFAAEIWLDLDGKPHRQLRYRWFKTFREARKQLDDWGPGTDLPL